MKKADTAATQQSKKKSAKQEMKEWAIAIGICMVFAVPAAYAQQAVADDELGDGICKVVNYFTGKWLFGIGVLSMLGAGGALLFGAELSDGIKKMVTIITIIGVILTFGSILSYAFKKFTTAGNNCSAVM